MMKFMETIKKTLMFILYTFGVSLMNQELPIMVHHLRSGYYGSVYDPVSTVWLVSILIGVIWYSAKLMIAYVRMLITFINWARKRVESKRQPYYIIWRNRPRKSHIKVR